MCKEISQGTADLLRIHPTVVDSSLLNQKVSAAFSVQLFPESRTQESVSRAAQCVPGSDFSVLPVGTDSPQYNSERAGPCTCGW